MITIMLIQPIASLFMSRCGACFVAMGLYHLKEFDILDFYRRVIIMTKARLKCNCVQRIAHYF